MECRLNATCWALMRYLARRVPRATFTTHANDRKTRETKIYSLKVYLIYLLFFSIISETTQLEDPRQEWRAIQEAMLREYLQTAQDVLEVSLECPFNYFRRVEARESSIRKGLLTSNVDSCFIVQVYASTVSLITL